ncbi:MAG: tetratricopeptide repeat protein [Candidatus Obscuribacterales bacterium]
MRHSLFLLTNLIPAALVLAFSVSAAPGYAQGIGEYGGLMGAPKHIPFNPNAHKTLHNVYTAPGRAAAGATSGSARASGQASAGVIQSGDVTGGGGVARAKIMQLSAESQKAYEKGQKFFKEGNFKEAEKFFNYSLKVREAYWKNRDPLIPEIYRALADIYEETGKTPEKEKALNEMLASYARIKGPGTKDRIEPLKELGDIYGSRGELWPSHDSYEQALILVERYDGKDSAQAVELKLRMAARLKDLDKLDRSAEAYKTALAINDEKHYVSGTDLADSLDDYAQVLRQLKKADEADKLSARAAELRSK